MQTIGLIGGMSWESSAAYYRLLNEGVQARLGGLHSARTIMTSVDFAEVTHLQNAEDWDGVAEILVEAARGVERAGADFLLLCTTAFHRVADQVEAAVDLPLVHLADVVARTARERRIHAVGLIGTKFATTRTFFTDRLAGHQLDVVVPPEEACDDLDRIIYDELVHGKITDASRRRVVRIVEDLWDAGVGGVILGCTELELLVHQADLELPVLPSTTLHVTAALDRALADVAAPATTAVAPY
ncbi:aspartate/glutamate racemase family protein [Nocardioides yefusunii]|uniref:Aspartate/glutamate racemase family protein n=1 Tax=Nocardioides yefusunii TaxID=2500546 RepID=A0ABW1QWL7_9ACTN|nr:aspartate/glutamate racemase family protein [Nocardioides yefusunii]